MDTDEDEKIAVPCYMFKCIYKYICIPSLLIYVYPLLPLNTPILLFHVDSCYLSERTIMMLITYIFISSANGTKVVTSAKDLICIYHIFFDILYYKVHTTIRYSR